MKVCISSRGDNESAPVDPRFGRCAYFCFHDTETGEYVFEKNSFTHAMGGVGVQASQHMVTKGVEAVCTGQVGPNAYQALEAAGIRVYTGLSGSIAEAAATIKEGGMEAAGGPTNDGHMV